ncbi:DUF481 domain-containing protein [Taibaiella soli]|uniref:DUF481 domain-containing protein n=1 Tax=Taibaiella soli TaxID=1649169 RepID=A0A2W2BT78_9BACT|nr:DUF481 domain-containing protein [Taibaiella soli]PZF70973.1 hypothetical protein DN068_19905 [Taibaiella soli]
MKKLLIFFLVILLFSKVSAQTLIRDTLFFKNGTMVIGKMKTVKLGLVKFDIDNIILASIQLRNIRTMTAVTKIFRVETIRHDVYYGNIYPSRKEGEVIVVSGGDSIAVAVVEISVLYAYRDAFMQRFSGNLSLGFNYTKSSSVGNVNYDNKLFYTARKQELGFAFAGNYSITDTLFNRDREDWSLKFNHYFSPVWFGTILGAYQRNLELSMLRRIQEGLGAGEKFLTKKSLYAWYRGGMVLNQETNTDNETSGTLAEVFMQFEFNFFRFIKPKISLTIAQTVYYNLSELGRFRNDGTVTLSYEAIKDLKFTLNFYNNYDSKPPVEGSQTFDYGATYGITYKF